MNTYSRSVAGLQKLFAAMALFAMVFSPLAGVQFASADTGGPGTITSAVYDEASNTLSVSGTYKDAPLGDKKTPGFAVFVNGDTPENKNKSLDNPITLLPHTETGVWSNTYSLNKAPTSVCIVIYDVDPTMDENDDGKHSLVPDGSKRNKDNSYDEKKWGDGSWLEGTCTTPEVVPDTVKICHATAAHGNPYNLQTPAKTADAGGHDGHDGPIWFDGIEVGWGDIIPPFDYDGGSYPGKNWDAIGQAFHENDCEVPDIYGCTDPSADNYDSSALSDDNSCTYTVLGCTDPEAINYNPDATDGNKDADECEYPDPNVPFISLNTVEVLACGVQNVELSGQVLFKGPNTTADAVVIYLNDTVVLDDRDMDDENSPDGELYPWTRTLTGVAPGTHTVKVVMYDDEDAKTIVRAESEEVEFTIETCPKYATIVAHKIVCTLESEIPNQSDWAGLDPIDTTTAQAWVDSHDSCDFEEGWEFEWVLNSEKTDPGDDTTGTAGGDWNTFGPTDINGMTSVVLDKEDLDGESKIWLREVLQTDYLPFSHNDDPDNSNDVTAAFFCNNDVLNYDNLEWIKDITLDNDEDYNCVAWNYIEPVLGCTDPKAENYDPKATQDDNSCEYPEPVCEIGDNLLENGSFEEPKVERGSLWDQFWNVIGWKARKVSDENAANKLELHRGWKGNEAAEGEQYAELDGNEPTRVSQEVTTLEGGLYELRWAFAPRQSTAITENELSVEVDGTEVKVTGPSAGIGVLSQDDWTRDSYQFVAGSDSTEIAFKDLGIDSKKGADVGTFLDDAVLCLVREPEPEDPWCTFEGVVIDHTEDVDAKTNGGSPVHADRRNPTAVETIAPYANFGGSEGNDWNVNPLDFFSLGIGGFVTYEFTGDVAFDQAGPDIAIYEITGGGANTDEKAEVFVSENGSDWVSLGDITGDAEVDIAPAGLSFVKYVKLVDKSQGVQGNNGDGYDLDGIVILDGSCGDEPDPEPKECAVTIVSDDTATVVEKGGAFAQLLSWTHPAWTAVISGASWIWGDDPVADPANPETQTFENKFGWAGTVDSAILYMASDNTHSATVNGGTAFVGGNSFGGAVSYDVSGEIAQGNNDLAIVVDNLAGSSNPQSNPAGVMYKLVVTTTDDVECNPPYEEKPELETITMCKYDENEEPVAGWGMTLTNGDDVTLDLETGNDGCVSYDVDPEDGPWEVYEEDRNGWTFVETYAVNGIVIDDEVADYCEFFGFQSEETQSLAFVAQDIEVQIDPEYICDFMNDEDEDTPRRSTGGGSSSPRCDVFGIDGDVLSWETRRGYDLEITLNGESIFSTDDNDEVKDGDHTLVESALVGDEFELTVNRGSRDDTCSFEIPGEGEVAGASDEILPLGAPDTGHGGASSVIPALPSLLAILTGMRRVKNA